MQFQIGSLGRSSRLWMAPWCWFVGFRYLPAGAGWPACFAATQPNPPADVQTRLQAVGPPQLLRNRTSAAAIRQPSMWGILLLLQHQSCTVGSYSQHPEGCWASSCSNPWSSRSSYSTLTRSIQSCWLGIRFPLRSNQI